MTLVKEKLQTLFNELTEVVLSLASADHVAEKHFSSSLMGRFEDWGDFQHHHIDSIHLT